MRTTANTTTGPAYIRHEPEILGLVDACDNGASFVEACDLVADAYKMSSDRLAGLARLWCGIAGVRVPS